MMNYFAIPGLLEKKLVPSVSIIDTIKIALTKHHGIIWFDADIKCRKKELIDFRFHFMWLVKNYTTYSLTTIGQLFTQKFDHSSVIHGIETWGDRKVNDRNCKRLHELVLNDLKEL